MQKRLHNNKRAGQLFCTGLFLFFIFGITSVVFGQAASTRLNGLYVTHVYAASDYEYGSLDNEYRWKMWFNDDLRINCIQKTEEDPGWFDITDRTLTSEEYIPNITTSSFELKLEAWEEDGCGGECSYGTGNLCSDDQGHCDKQDMYLELKYYEPGMTHTKNFYYCNSNYGVRYQFSYDVPQPSKPSMTASGFVCNGTITLSANSYLGSFLPSTDFLWYYYVNGNEGYLGTSHGYSSNGNFSITVDQLRQKPWIAGITQNTAVTFKVKSRYNATNGASYSGELSEVSNIVQISPVAPTLSNLQITPSCPNAENPSGTILATVNGVFSSNYLYVLKPLGNTAPCNPETGNPACGTVIASGRSYWNYVYIQGIPAGSYNLVVMNPAGDNGICGTYIPVTVGALPVLQESTPSITHVSCQGKSDGVITVASSGGVQPITYQLSKNGFLQTNTTGVFDSLVAGTYTAKIKDNCNQEINRSLVVLEPVRVNAVVSPTYPSCNSPADGRIQINNITGGNGEYIVKLMSGTEVIRENHLFRSFALTYENVMAGEYNLEIKDANRMQCDGFSQAINLVSPVSLQIPQASVIKTNVSCYGRNDASIQLNNVNITGAFQYILTNQTTGSSANLTTSSQFSGLPAGNYTLAMKRNIASCNDRFDYPETIVVTQPERMEVTLQKQNITCYGETDGKITSIISGATSSDQYHWEIKLGNSWATLNRPASSLSNLSAGAYRMKLSNAGGCEVMSNEVVIVEPQVLTISSVIIKDMVCFWEKGEIETTLQGGVPPYSYEYSSSSGNVNATSSKTYLDKGVYTLIAKDVNGCAVSYPQPLTITAPAAPLDMSYKLSDFNGYNISCAGASNGSIDITPSGGNGGNYSGYKYSIDGQAYGQNARIENIKAGNHTINIRDGRGCVVSKPVVMIEPAAQIKLELLSKEDVKCSGDYNGSLSLSATGGVEPYVYTLNGKISQSSGRFTLLAPGDYTINIADKNGCSAVHQATVNLLNPSMSVLIQKSEVSCYGGADGEIKVEVTGGAPPFNYSWDKSAGSTANPKNLSAGDYKLQVSDQQGCIQERTINLLQPEKLVVKVRTIPVCVGKTNGSIHLEAAGGTPSYQYSIDGGIIYQSNPQFTVGAGKYEVRIKDSKRCEVSSIAEVITRNDQPQPNFIVASAQDALDTLVIKEISVPKPDSVEWIFDPAITVVKHDAWSPVITVKDPGTYAVGMKGFFGGCDYTNNLTLTFNPFDPEEKKLSKAIPIKAIQKLLVTPNPNEGEFEVSVELNAKQRLSIKVFDVLGMVHYKENLDKTSGTKIKVNVPKTGVYIVQAVTDTDAQELRVIVNK